jgi:hypothetical protein
MQEPQLVRLESHLNDVAAMTVVRFVLELFLLSDLSSS